MSTHISFAHTLLNFLKLQISICYEIPIHLILQNGVTNKTLVPTYQLTLHFAQRLCFSLFKSFFIDDKSGVHISFIYEYNSFRLNSKQ